MGKEATLGMLERRKWDGKTVMGRGMSEGRVCRGEGRRMCW